MVGPEGDVVGVDCCNAFLQHARNEAVVRGLENLRFERGDAEVSLPVDEVDLVFARFGTMYFSNPVVALRNMRRVLRPGGRMVHVVWREQADNPWLSLARDVVLRFLPQPGAGIQTFGPGPFSMANENTVRTVMMAAGFTDIEFERVDAPLLVGTDLDDAIRFQLTVGPAGKIFRDAGLLAEKMRPAIENALAEELDSQKRDAEGILMDSSSWVISAKNPAH